MSLLRMHKQDNPEVNIDQLLEKFRDLGKRFGVGGGGIFPLAVFGILGIVLLIWLASGFYTVQPAEQAVLRKFGAFDTIEGSGLHWFWPSPLGSKLIVNVQEVRRLELGVRGSTPILSESLMITGDPDEDGNAGEAPNIVDVQLLVQYDIKDVTAYVFKVVDPDGITIKDATETSLRQVVGSRPIDDILTDKKEDVQAETKELLQHLMDFYETGINIREVKLLNVFAPEQVKDAFDDVVRAKEDKARIINLADAYREDILPRARGDAAILTQAAFAFKQEQIAKAIGQSSRYLAVLEEYEKAPQVTRERLYLEAIEKILPETTIFIIGTGDGNLLQFLPLTKSDGLLTPEKSE